MRIKIVCLASLLLASGCGNAESDTAPEPVSTPQTTATLTTDYVRGTWCLIDVSMMGTVTDMNENYAFEEDGNLYYQTGSTTQKRTRGKWRIEGDRLFVDAGFLTGSIKVKEIGPDHFILNHTWLYRFERGSCDD